MCGASRCGSSPGYPDDRCEVLLDVPRYEFDLQNLHVLDRPGPMPEGTLVGIVSAIPSAVTSRAVPATHVIPPETSRQVSCSRPMKSRADLAPTPMASTPRFRQRIR
jgi:hypothetical protein